MRSLQQDRLLSRERARQAAPRPRLDLLFRGDVTAALFLVLAAFLSLAAGFQQLAPDRPPSLLIAPPIAAGVFTLGLVAMVMERRRHGLVRALSLVGAGWLCLWGLLLAHQVAMGRLLTFFFLPAVLAGAAALQLSWSRRDVRALEARQRERQRPRQRPGGGRPSSRPRR